jgi:hypothetical protein
MEDKKTPDQVIKDFIKKQRERCKRLKKRLDIKDITSADQIPNASKVII